MIRGAALLLGLLAACAPAPEAEQAADGGEVPASLQQALAAAAAQAAGGGAPAAETADPDAIEAELDALNEAEAANEEAALSNPVGERWFLTEDGGVRIETDPYAPRPFRRADYDQNVTLLAPNVALVVQPAIGAPIGVSNMLGGALVRRFAGALRMKEALSAARVFVIQPRIGGAGLPGEEALIVDWRLRSEGAEDVGLVYASRRLTGDLAPDNPWAAFTPADAEHIALQTAAHLLETPAVQTALISARGNAVLERTPSPRAKPQSAEAAEAAEAQTTTAPAAPQPKPRP